MTNLHLFSKTRLKSCKAKPSKPIRADKLSVLTQKSKNVIDEYVGARSKVKYY